MPAKKAGESLLCHRAYYVAIQSMRCLATGRVNCLENAQETRNQGHHRTCPSANQVSYHVSFVFSYSNHKRAKSRSFSIDIFDHCKSSNSFHVPLVPIRPKCCLAWRRVGARTFNLLGSTTPGQDDTRRSQRALKAAAITSQHRSS